jgi:hypothetical protein
MSPFEWFAAVVIALIVLSLDAALIRFIFRASGDFTEMRTQQGQMVHFMASMEREIKQLAVEFRELAKVLEVANGVERQELGQPAGAGGDD